MRAVATQLILFPYIAIFFHIRTQYFDTKCGEIGVYGNSSGQGVLAVRRTETNLDTGSKL